MQPYSSGNTDTNPVLFYQDQILNVNLNTSNVKSYDYTHKN